MSICEIDKFTALVKNASCFIVYLASIYREYYVLYLSIHRQNLVFVLLQIIYYIFILRFLLELIITNLNQKIVNHRHNLKALFTYLPTTG
jgi:hypothetical protein